MLFLNEFSTDSRTFRSHITADVSAMRKLFSHERP